MTNENVHELAAAYALDALPADERQEFESHLPGCAYCRSELASLQETVGALGLAAEGPAPPAALRDRILVAAREEPPTVVALRPRRIRRLYVGSAVAAAASAALAIGLWLGLSGGPGGPRLALSFQQSGAAELAVSGLDPAPAGKVYEIWVIQGGGNPQPAGVFSVSGEGIDLTRPVPDGAVVAVTLERAPGATKPTLPILAQTTASV